MAYKKQNKSNYSKKPKNTPPKQNKRIPIKPCPFCGSEVSVKKSEYGSYTVMCLNGTCKVLCHTMPADTPEEAIGFWNNREKKRREIKNNEYK